MTSFISGLGAHGLRLAAGFLVLLFCAGAIAAADAPVIVNATAHVGSSFSYQISAVNGPTAFTATGLPAGCSLNAATGLISGTPTTAGILSTTVTASNATGTGTATVTINVLPHAPVITSAATAAGVVGAAFSYQITANYVPTSYLVSGLPPGLTYSATAGAITGTPTATGSSTVSISASNAGGTATANLAVTITSPIPVITSPSTFTINLGSIAPPAYQITATNAPTSFGVIGTLPTGLTLDTTTGIFSSNFLSSFGTFNLTVTATNANGTGSAPLALTVLPPLPQFTSPNGFATPVGTPFTYQAQANYATSYGATGLPTGFTFSPVSGVISGTPTALGTISSIVVTATNTAGTTSLPLTIVVTPPPPVITSSATASGMVGSAFSFQITGTNSPTAFTATGFKGAPALPAGLTLSATSGAITGIPTTAGSATATITASNAGGTASGTLVITIAPPIPVITSASTFTINQNSLAPPSYQITATNAPTSFGVTGTLPTGLTLNTSTGVFNSGFISSFGTFNLTVKATNANGTGSAPLTLTVLPPAPQITSSSGVATTVGSPFSYQILANYATSYSATGLPAGWTFNATTGVITGTPTALGTISSITVTATNVSGAVSLPLTIWVNPPPPVITSATTAGGVVGTAFSYQITATNSPTSFTATGFKGGPGLPAGLTLSATSGAITGIPTSAGSATVSVTAGNAGGSGSANLVVTIAPSGSG